MIRTNCAICAARHFIAAYNSAAQGRAVDFGSICVGCPVWSDCRGDWLKTAAPLFEAAQIRPELITSSHE